MTPEQVERQADTFELVNFELAASHDRQSDALDKVDSKVVVIIGYAVGAGAFLATRRAQPVLEILAYAALVAALAWGISAYRIRDYEDIDPVKLYFKYAATTSKAETLARLGVLRAHNYRHNQKLLKRKAEHWLYSIAALLLGTVLMVAAILVQTYRHDDTGKPAGTARPSAVPTASRSSVRPSSEPGHSSQSR